MPLPALRAAILAAEAGDAVLSEEIGEAKELEPVLVTAELRAAMDAMGLARLRLAITKAEAEGVVTAEVIDDAKKLVAVLVTELATQKLRAAMEGRNVVRLRSAITTADKVVDEAILQEAKNLLPEVVLETLHTVLHRSKLVQLRAAVAAAAEEGDVAQQVDPSLLAEAQLFLADESLRSATKWYPLDDLRVAIEAAEASEPGVDRAALAEARAKLSWLATEELRVLVRKRQLEPLVAAVVTAEAERPVEGVLAKARALVAKLEAGPPRAPPAPAGTYPMDMLVRPAHIDDEHLGSLMRYKPKQTAAIHDYKYWGGAEQPWRNGVDDTPVTEAAVIVWEYTLKLLAEADDDPLTAGTPAHATTPRPSHAEKLRGYGVRVDFLLALTFALELWEWKTWEVVQYLVKPATEGSERCRFAELEAIRLFTGSATVFMSHCWGGRWGDLVAAACCGGDANRVVW